MNEYEEFANRLDSSLFLKDVQRNEDWSMWIPDHKKMKMYAHYLFNYGILTGENGCFGGTLKRTSEQQIDYLESK